MDATRVESSHVCLAVGNEFTSYGALLDAVHSLLELRGMPRSNLCVKSQEVFSEEDATEFFGVPKHNGKPILQRFQFYCNHSSTCPFRIPTSYFKTRRVFRILDHGGSDLKKIGTTDHCLAHDRLG